MQPNAVDLSHFNQAMNSVKSHNLSLKYQRFAPSSCEDIGVRRFEFDDRDSIFWLLRKVFQREYRDHQIKDKSLNCLQYDHNEKWEVVEPCKTILTFCSGSS